MLQLIFLPILLLESAPCCPSIVRELALVPVAAVALLKVLAYLLNTVIRLLVLLVLLRLLRRSLALSEGIHLLRPSSPAALVVVATPPSPCSWLLKPYLLLPLALTAPKLVPTRREGIRHRPASYSA